ncbi:type IV pilus biogenesis/stability protein PilW [Pseudoxanthomonas sangjuensis]|uniref:type IV pilus biogenesis/stability protein PilW n=1 Tax=Pseudoxanthomonas sangjuensis TaxID=1503750 RepID=UPI001391031E|nr:type IV pilus biogenesis/stability protein PilW [Pseudoxanthomonas sangjuensis]KAF1713625.1 type IV pilus biogenesis/stability protein PilW [Pseudoxanthomonas sangjuensis]
MRLREALVPLLVLALSATACSRLTFIRPASKIERYEPAAPAYSVHDSEQTKRRLAAQERLQLASQRLQAGDIATAERQARLALKRNPDSAGAHTLLAIIEQSRGQQEAAGAHYRQAAELAPADGGVLNNYGAWLCGNGYPAEALVWFDRALAAPNYATPAAALANAGGCALKSGQYERGERDLRKALELDPVNAYALASMAEGEFRQGRYLEARAFTERRLAAAPANADVLQLARNIENALGDRVAASRYEQRLRTEFPDAANTTTNAPGRASEP